MKKLLLVPALFIGIGIAQAQNQPPNPPVQCISSAVYEASAQGLTQLVAAVTGSKIYVCGYTLVGDATNRVGLVTGTGSNCATGATNLTPLWAMVAQMVVTDSSTFYRGIITPASQALCIRSVLSASAQGIIYYSQFQ